LRYRCESLIERRLDEFSIGARRDRAVFGARSPSSKVDKETTMAILLRVFVLTAALLLAGSAHAVDGVESDSILLGMSAPFTGVAGPFGLELKEGVEAYFAKVNSAGGVFGRKIKLESLDDGYNTGPAVANTHRLIEKDKVFALIAFYGSSSSEAVLPVLEADRVPLVGTISGAGPLRSPDNHYLFNVRASYRDETAAIVEYLTTIGINRIAVYYQDDGFGQSGLDGTTAALAKHKLAPVATGTVPRNSVDVGPAVEKIAKAHPQAVVMVTLGKATTEFITRMRATGETPTFLTLSPVGTNTLIKLLGADKAIGIVVSQVMPDPFSDRLLLVREYKKTLTSYKPNAHYSSYSLEGYIYAKLMVEALTRCGANLTRERLNSALRSGAFDLGGFWVHFGAGGESGSKYVEMSVIGADGKVVE
jgi:ABC-type branched-subunit amino acid transport system substrate-binding protein